MIKEKNIPQVSLESMNKMHLEEVIIINKVFQNLENGADFETLSKSFEQLLEHMQEHFSSEELLMKKFHYPSLNMHKADHDKVLNQARYAQMQWRNKKDSAALKEFLEDDIVAWLDQHIKAMDVPMADFTSCM